MGPDIVAEEAGAQTEAIVEAALEEAEAREEAAAEIVDQVVESARQSAVVNTVEAKFSEIEAWRGDVERRLTESLSSVERLAGQLTETVETLALLQAASTPEPEPEPTPEPELIPEPPPTLPENAEDGQRESPEAPEPERHKPSRPKRRFW